MMAPLLKKAARWNLEAYPRSALGDLREQEGRNCQLSAGIEWSCLDSPRRRRSKEQGFVAPSPLR
jgi:hypothetical protein